MNNILEKYTTKEIMYNEGLQQQAQKEMLQRVNVMGKVKELLSSPRNWFINISKVAELYEIEETKVLSLLGIAEGVEGEHNILVSRMDILRIAFLLTDSEVAKELRNQISRVRDIA